MRPKVRSVEPKTAVVAPAAEVRGPDPEEQALELLSRFVERMAVAKSLARMTAELVGAHAQHASETLRVYAGAAMTEVAGSVALGVASGEERLRVHVQKLQRIARATAASAAHAAQASEARRTRPRKPRDESVGTTTDAGEPDDE